MSAHVLRLRTVLILVILLLAGLRSQAAAENLYWSEYPPQCASGSTLRKAVDGQPGTNLLSSSERLNKIIVDTPQRQIYWASGAGKVYRGDLDAPVASDVVTVSPPYSLRGFSLDTTNQKIYWVEGVGCSPCGGGACPNCPRIRRSNLDGSIPEIVHTLSGSTNTADIAVDPKGGKVYWVDLQYSPYLSRVGMDGTNVEPLITTLSTNNAGINNIVTDGTHLYWTESSFVIPGSQIVQRSALDGTDAEPLATYLGVSLALRGLSLDPACRRLYYGIGGYCPNDAESDIFRVNLDTLSSDHPYTGLGLVSGLAVEAGADADNDGTPNCNDACPNDSAKIAAGVCGCGISDADSDGDGTRDCNDGCDNDPGKIGAGVCGCGIADADSDGNGVLDCLKLAELKARVADLAALVSELKKSPKKKQIVTLRAALEQISAYAAAQGAALPVSGSRTLAALVNDLKKRLDRLTSRKVPFSRGRNQVNAALGNLSAAIQGG